MTNDATLADELAAYLDRLEAAHRGLAEAAETSRVAVRSADAAALADAAGREQRAAIELRTRLEERAELLRTAASAGVVTSDLAELTERLGDRRLIDRVARLRVDAAHGRREAWARWVAVRRAGTVCGELLSLVAGGGRVTYAAPGSHAASAGGSLLDASA